PSDDEFSDDDDEEEDDSSSNRVAALSWLRTTAVRAFELPVLEQFFPPLADVIGASVDDPLAQPGQRSDDQRFVFGGGDANGGGGLGQTGASTTGAGCRTLEVLLAASRDGRIQLSAAGALGLFRFDLNSDPERPVVRVEA